MSAVRVVSESDWLRLVGLDGRRREVHSLYTPAMLCQSLNVPIGTIRRWERLGLIRAVRKVYRLPYFDFSEAAGVRRLSDLLTAGVPRTQLESSLIKLRSMLPGLDRPLAQLNLLAQDAQLLVRDAHGLVEPSTGQRCFDFVPPAPPGEVIALDQSPANARPRRVGTASSRSLNDRHCVGRPMVRRGLPITGCARNGSSDRGLSIGLDEPARQPGDQFPPGRGPVPPAIRTACSERYYAAVEADHDYLEAWTQIGCLHAAQGELQSGP